MIVNTTADPPITAPILLRLLLSEIAGNQNRDTHSKLYHHKSHQVQHLASGRNCGKSGGGTKSSHHQKVHRSVSRLQDQCTQEPAS